MRAATALVEFAGDLYHQIVLLAGVLWTAIPLRPMRALESLEELHFGAVVVKKLGDLLRQESSKYGLSGSLNETAEAGFLSC